MGLLTTNFAATTLASGIGASDTVISVTSAGGFPAPVSGAGDWFWAVIAATDETAWEVVKVTAASVNSLTVERGQDGTTARSWASGSRFEVRPVAAIVSELADGTASRLKRSAWAGTALTYALAASVVYLGLTGRSGAGVGVYDSGFGVQNGSTTAFSILTAEGQRTIDALGVWPVYTKPRTNLLPYSQDFSNAAWTKIAVSVGTGPSAPDGSGTMGLLTPTNAVTSYLQRVVSVVPNSKYTLSIYIAAGTSDLSFLRVWNQSVTVEVSRVHIIWTNGVPSISTSTGGATYTVEKVTDSVYRVSMTFNTGANSNIACTFYPDGANGPKTVSVWGAQLEAGNEATRYILTTASATTATPAFSGSTWNPVSAFKSGAAADLGSVRPRSWEPARLVYTSDRVNRLKASERLSLPSWTLTNGTVVTEAVTAPDGVSLADRFVEAAVTGAHNVQQVITAPGTTLTLSAYLKAYTRDFACLNIGPVKVYADLTLGTVGTVTGGTGTASIYKSEGGWYRVILTSTPVAGGCAVGVNIATGTMGAPVDSYAGDTSKGIYAWGFQVEDGSEATEYIPSPGSSAAAVPGVTAPAEWDGTGPAVYLTDWQGRRRLYSTARTNRLTYASDMSSASGWASSSAGTGSAATCVSSAGNAPDGGTAYRIQLNRGAGTTLSDYSRWAHASMTPPAVLRTASIWLKSNTGSPQVVAFEIESGAYAVVRVDSTWRRFSISRVHAGVSTGLCYVTTRGTYGTDQAIDVLAAYPQWEDGAFATSFIPVPGASEVSVTDYTLSGNTVTLASGGVSGGVLSWIGLQDVEAAHAATLPKASSVGAGKAFWITDEGGIVDSTHPLTIAAAGGDRINGATGWQVLAARSRVLVVSDGVSSWSATTEIAFDVAQAIADAGTGGGGGTGAVMRVSPPPTAYTEVGSSSYNNYSVVTKIAGLSLITKGTLSGAVIRWRLSSTSTTASVATAVIKRTLAGSNAWIDTETLKIGGNPITTLPAGTVEFDPLAMQIDVDHDYYIIIYFAATGNATTALPSVGIQSPCFGGYVTGDKTGVADASAVGVSGTTTYGFLGIYATVPNGTAISTSDLLSPLLNNEVGVTSAGALNFGKMHSCTATSADYTVTLPSPSSNAGKLVGIRIASSSTKLVTVDAGAGNTIDGQRTRIMWANEVAILVANGDGTSWTKIAGKTLPMSGGITGSGNLTFASGVTTLLTNWNNSLFLDAPPAFQVLASQRLVALRPGRYTVTIFGAINTTNPSSALCFLVASKNGTANTAYDEKWSVASNALGLNATLIVSLVVGDYIAPYGTYIGGSFATSYLIADAGNNFLTVTEIPTW